MSFPHPSSHSAFPCPSWLPTCSSSFGWYDDGRPELESTDLAQEASFRHINDWRDLGAWEQDDRSAEQDKVGVAPRARRDDGTVRVVHDHLTAVSVRGRDAGMALTRSPKFLAQLRCNGMLLHDVVTLLDV